MSEFQWIRSHVERLLQDEWEVCTVVADGDGDYGFRFGRAACWVSVLASEPVMVRVFAHAAVGVKPTLAVLRELNDIQCRALSSSISIEDGIVHVVQTLSPIGLTQPVLAQAMKSVGGVANDIGVLMAGVFGGATPYPVEQDEDEAVA